MKDQKPKVVGSGVAGGAGVVLVWAWSLIFPEQPMPPEIGALVGGSLATIYGPLVRKFERWIAS